MHYMIKNIILFSFLLAIPLYSCNDDEVSPQSEEQEEQETSVLEEASYPLQTISDLDVLLNEIGGSRYVLLGEASHGTSEYYTWRAEISKRLIEEKGFNIIAVEGDWPALYRLNQYIRGSAENGSNSVEVLRQLNRWPTWMWANGEVADFAEWLHKNN